MLSIGGYSAQKVQQLRIFNTFGFIMYTNSGQYLLLLFFFCGFFQRQTVVPIISMHLLVTIIYFSIFHFHGSIWQLEVDVEAYSWPISCFLDPFASMVICSATLE